MADSALLPYSFPWFAYTQGSAAPCIAMSGHPTAYNAILNQCTTLSCDPKFLDGFTTPQIKIPRLGVKSFSCIERYAVSWRIAHPYHRDIIKRMLDEGFYIYFNGVDDYFMDGKSWYGIRHIKHDGIICGYDDGDGSYSIAAYDSNWVFRLMRIPQKCFTDGLNEGVLQGWGGGLTVYRMKDMEIPLDERQMLGFLKAHVDSDMDRFPLSGREWVEGIAVQGFLALYIGKLIDGSIPYEKMDWRILRPVWEHKKCMLDRLIAFEKKQKLDTECSTEYRPLVDAADRARMMYAVYHRNRRADLLEKVQRGLLEGKEKESAILRNFIKKAEATL